MPGVVQDYFNFVFQIYVISVINNPAVVTKTNATFIDHILTNLFNSFMTDVMETDIWTISQYLFLTSQLKFEDSQKNFQQDRY